MRYDRLLWGKNAVVTDAGNAVGRAVVRKFARHGARVIFGVPDEACGERIHEEIRAYSQGSFYVRSDLADPAAVEAFCTTVNRHCAYVSALVNSPWARLARTLTESDEDQADRLLQIYQRSIVQTMRALLGQMTAAGGCSVVDISSNAVYRALGGEPLYVAANAALGGLVRVHAVEGGVSETRINELLISYAACDDAPAPCPLRTEDGGERADIEGAADAALFLASDLSSYVTGVSLHADGGAARSLLPLT